jgi:hypothetical protein
MQQTKRRGKKGVILLALAFALVVLAIMPGAALAATQSVSVNNGAAWIGTTSVALTLDAGDLTTATQVTVQDNYNGGAFFLATPVKIPIPTNPYTYIMQSNATPLVNGVYVVKVTWYPATGAALGTATATVTFDNSRVVSVLALRATTPLYSPPGPGWPGDYGVQWFGPVAPFSPANGTFTTTGNPLVHSVVYRVDSQAWIDNLAPWANPTFFYAGPVNGIHTVQHYGVAQDTLLTQGPVTNSKFGWDSVAPTWSWNGTAPDPDVWYGNAPISWSARVSDTPGSGVASATANYWRAPGFPGSIFATVGATPIEWTPYQFDIKGTLTPAPSWDANQATRFTAVSLNATDRVGNELNDVAPINFDLVAPHTSFDTTSTGSATSQPYLGQFVWTNKPVTINFLAMDPGAPLNGSGVAYTEYFVGDESMTAPGMPTKGTSVTISKSAPTGPVYIWYRSVDKAVPANVEVWQKLYVYFDNVPPKITLEQPSGDWWINHGDRNENMTVGKGDYSGREYFDVILKATDIHSGLAKIEFSMPTWIPAFAKEWNTYTGGIELFVDRAGHATDGIFPFSYRASDVVGNSSETSTTDIKIDTRAPVTDGASEWTNGNVPYVLTATDQVTGAGVAATIYRVDQSTPWLINEATKVGPTLETAITLTGGQGASHTIDFGSVDAALPYDFPMSTWVVADDGPTYAYGNLEGVSWQWSEHSQGFEAFSGYKTRTVKLDVTAPVVTAMDPKLGEWQKGPAIINFSGTDVGSGYAYTEWKTSGTDWTKGEVASIGGNGEITVTYHGVDKVGIKSADQTIVVKVASTRPSATGGNVSVKRGHKATFKFNVTAVTPTATSVVIEIRSKATGRTFITKRFANVTTNSDQTRSFKINLKKGKYNIRISATDAAGNVQAKRGGGTLTVK